MSQQSHSHSVQSGDSLRSRSRKLLDEDDSDADPGVPPNPKGVKRAHLLDESSGSEDEHNLGDGKSSAKATWEAVILMFPRRKGRQL